MTSTPKPHARIALIGFGLALVLAWVSYQPAVSGDWQLDDRANLGGLAAVTDADSTLDFILAGAAGPLGRPIALASFAAQAGSWGDGAAPFLKVNIAIHLLNAILLAVCIYRLTLLLPAYRRQALPVAALAASIWVLMPLLATSSLLVVQRMTTLSATFVLLGLAAYLLARSRLAVAPRAALAGMSVSLTAGTLLAALTKESGLLLPVYVLVLEATLLPRPSDLSARTWRSWQAGMLGLPLLIIVAYLAYRSGYPQNVVLRRGFDAGERLLTEAQILWIYLYKAVLGRPSTLGIFQEGPSVVRSLLQPAALLASLTWLASVVLAIAWRRRYPLFAFAVLWFLGGHLLESTVIPLELYFEHRNYLPIAGPVAALSLFVIHSAPRVRAGLGAALAILLVANTWFLVTFASLWGEPSQAARYWAMRYPDSVRAVTTMASYQMAEESMQRADQTLDRFVSEHPEHGYLRIQQLNLRCRYAPGEAHTGLISALERGLPAVTFTYTAGKMLAELFAAVAGNACTAVDADTVTDLALRLKGNPRYRSDPLYNQFHHKLLAAIARYQGHEETTLAHLRSAIGYRPSSELNMMMVTTLAGGGDFDAARKFIEDAGRSVPLNPLRAAKWNRDLEGLAAYVRELEKVSQ